MRTFTQFHVALSLAAILAGLVVATGLVTAKPSKAWTTFFLWTTTLTSVTGFFFPFHGFTPALTFGVISMVVLAVAFFALYKRQLAGAWRWIYVAAVLAFYLNFFVLVVQAFQKVPALHALAPTQTEPPFAIAQGVTLVAFVALGVIAVRRFRPAPVTAG